MCGDRRAAQNFLSRASVRLGSFTAAFFARCTATQPDDFAAWPGHSRPGGAHGVAPFAVLFPPAVAAASPWRLAHLPFPVRVAPGRFHRVPAARSSVPRSLTHEWSRSRLVMRGTLRVPRSVSAGRARPSRLLGFTPASGPHLAGLFPLLCRRGTWLPWASGPLSGLRVSVDTTHATAATGSIPRRGRRAARFCGPLSRPRSAHGFSR
jgi:hypothetical protein